MIHYNIVGALARRQGGRLLRRRQVPAPQRAALAGQSAPAKRILSPTGT